MSQIKAKLLAKDSQSLQDESGNLAVKIESNKFLAKTASGLKVLADPNTTSALNLWPSDKISSELSSKASTSYVDGLIVGIARKGAVIDFVTQAVLDGLTPNTGDRYIITDGTNINKIAEYNGSSWDYTVPSENWLVIRSSDDTDYTYDPDIVAAFKWAVSGTKQAEKNKTQTFTLDAGMITAKKVVLTYTPTAAGNVKVYFGIAQQYSVDYTVTGKDVDWTGLGLESLLASGDVLIVDYPTFE